DLSVVVNRGKNNLANDSLYLPDVIDAIFEFRAEDHCWVRQRRDTAHTDEEYTEMFQTLAMPGMDWHYTSRGVRAHLQATEMMPVAKGWAKWLVRNFESCLNETEIIMSRCHAVYAIMRGEPIRVGEMIARSIKRMITAAYAYIGHPFVITTLC
ncbi:hypothetical protein A2U01_0052819, partial [Trifolium medium]|nr:hypothetical protein [Trifolium medium]